MVHWNIAQWRAVDGKTSLTSKKTIKKGHLPWRSGVIGWSTLTKLCLIRGLSKLMALPSLVPTLALQLTPLIAGDYGNFPRCDLGGRQTFMVDSKINLALLSLTL